MCAGLVTVGRAGSAAGESDWETGEALGVSAVG